MPRPTGAGSTPPCTRTEASVSDASTVRDDLVARLLDHLSWVCVTGDEDPIATAVTTRYAELGLPVTRVANSVVVDGRVPGRGRPLVLLVGHLDVVPPTDDDLRPRLEDRADGEVVVGRGASDMKAGNVAAMAAFEDAALRDASPYDLALVLYGGEEGGADDNELLEVLETVPWLTDAALAIVLEPTDGEVQLGCLGGLQAEVTFVGQQAHSARPWHGRNALTMAGSFLAELDVDHLRDVTVDGIAFRDAWSATMAWSDGLAPGTRTATPFRNVVPGRFTVNLNFRFAPSRGLDEAEAELRARVGDRAEVVVVDRAPPAPPKLTDATVRAFIDAVGAPVAAKQAWTDVARFAEVGVPALNFGPGLTAQAHQRGEFVPVDALVAGHQQLVRFLRGGAA
ncbi:succinyl-diaminopimelate desuccinylase [Nitriliruptoraceae bacterium ZYF776]|nr:succinyl-diaminopimelate desuccinylase [Profundirhabdus halotolerans]